MGVHEDIGYFHSSFPLNLYAQTNGNNSALTAFMVCVCVCVYAKN